MPASGRENTKTATAGLGLPQTIVIALLVTGAAAVAKLAADRLSRLAARAAERSRAEARARETGVATARDAGTLVWDEAKGVYRPK